MVFLQFFSTFYGPFEYLNGLVTWFQRPIDNNTQGLNKYFPITKIMLEAGLVGYFFFSLAFALVKKEKSKKSPSFMLTQFS